MFYGAPLEGGGPLGEAFSSASGPEVLKIAVESCKANTVKDQWSNCSEGRWINTGSYLLVAAVCTFQDLKGDAHGVLWFLKDGVTASDEEIYQTANRQLSYETQPGGHCQKVAVFDRSKPARNEVEESQIARSVAKDKAR